MIEAKNGQEMNDAKKDSKTVELIENQISPEEN